MLEIIRKVTESKTWIIIVLYQFKIFPYLEFCVKVLLSVNPHKSTEKENTDDRQFHTH